MYGDKILFFDFDGTIANTEMYHKLSARKALNHYGIYADVSSYYGKGKSNREILMKLENDINCNIPIDDIISLKNSLFKKVAVDLAPYDSMKKLINSLPNRKFIITKNEQDIVINFLKKWDMKKCFQNVISLSGTDMSKSDMIVKIGLAAENCVLFDDTFNIVIDAIDKGIQGVFVKNGKVETITNEDWLDHLAWDVKAYWLAGLCNRAGVQYMDKDNKLMSMSFWKDWLDSDYDGSARKMRF